MRKRYAVFFSLFFVAFIVIALWLFRNPLFIYIANNALAPYQSRITCAEFSLQEDLNLLFSRVCLSHALGEVEINRALIDWKYHSYFSAKLQHVSVSKMVVRNLSTSLFDAKHEKSGAQHSLEGWFKLLTATSFDIPINVEAIEVALPQSSATYRVSLSNEKHLKQFTVTIQKDNQSPPYLSAHATVTANDIKLSSKLNTEPFLQELKKVLGENTRLDVIRQLEGIVNVNASWVHDNIKVTIATEKLELGLNYLDEPLNLSSQLDMDIDWRNQMVSVLFADHTSLEAQFNNAQLLSFVNSIDPKAKTTLTNILNDNPLGTFTLLPRGKLDFTLSENAFTLEQLQVSSREMVLNLSQLSLDADLDQFAVSGSFKHNLQLVSVFPQLKTPIAINADFSLKKQGSKTQLSSKRIELQSKHFDHISANNSKFIVQDFTLSSALELTLGDEMNVFKLLNAQFHAHSIEFENAHQEIVAINNIRMSSNLRGKTDPETQMIEWEKAHIEATQIAFPENPTLLSQFNLITEGLVSTKTNQIPTISVNTKASGALNHKLLKKPTSFHLTTSSKGSFDNVNSHFALSHQNSTLLSGTLATTSEYFTTQLSSEDLDLPKWLNALDLASLKPLKLKSGSAKIAVNIPKTKFSSIPAVGSKLSIEIRNLTGQYQESPWTELNLTSEFSFDGNAWISTLPSETNLHIKSALKEKPLKSIASQAQFSYQFDKVQPLFTLNLHNLKTRALGGIVTVDTMTWPINDAQQVNIGVEQISLKQLLALQTSEGIVVEGSLSGALPMYLQRSGNKMSVEIKEGALSNDGPGIIQVKNNPGIASMKSQQSNLKLAFDALENLQYHTLKADVSMGTSGHMNLNTKILGYNPDLDNDVNFNLNLTYDLPGLIKSLQLASQLEQRLIKQFEPKTRKLVKER
ncbi:hypothetical protein PALB_25140 [Pseudoalteromonas luteoviolacea B = ATCC 29581]|nr:hypothetical protein PALB_25140 [Pseudoalteromonas luteoviolacea B = ATCC 29581]